MKEKAFLDKSSKPTEQALQTALGNAYICYERIIDIANSYFQTWIFTKSGGWMLKVYDRSKALFYLIPLKEGLRISLTLRENERETFLQDDDLKAMRDEIFSSRKYPEGFAMQFSIADEKEFQTFELFIKKLIAERS